MVLQGMAILDGSSPARQTAEDRPYSRTVLLEDASNLGLVLNYLQNQPARSRVNCWIRMREFYPSKSNDIHTNLIGGTVQIFFHEKGAT